MNKSAETFHTAPKQVHLVETDIPETTGGHVTAARQRKVRMKPSESIHKFASALIGELEKQAMHPAMKAQQAKYKARMDDKDGDGEEEPDTEELTKEEREERFARLKKTAGRNRAALAAPLGAIAAHAGDQVSQHGSGYIKKHLGGSAAKLVREHVSEGAMKAGGDAVALGAGVAAAPALAALHARKGRKLKTAAGAGVGSAAGGLVGSLAGPAGTMVGHGVGSAIGARLAHGHDADKKARDKYKAGKVEAKTRYLIAQASGNKPDAKAAYKSTKRALKATLNQAGRSAREGDRRDKAKAALHKHLSKLKKTTERKMSKK